jgi:hypothetical protein
VTKAASNTGRLTFRGVGRGQSLKHSPLETVSELHRHAHPDQAHRNSHQNSPRHKRLDVLREERDEDEGDHRDQRPDHRKPIAIPLCNNTVDEQATDFTDSRPIRQPTLPRRGNLVFARLVFDTEFLVERWECEERGDEHSVCYDDQGQSVPTRAVGDLTYRNLP